MLDLLWRVPLALGIGVHVLADSPRGKGMRGEAKVRRRLRRFVGEGGKLFNNLVIPGLDGTTEIDHVLVCTRGVFVIETKNIGGWIYCRARDKKWTQKLHPGHSRSFHNPIHQNWGHLKSLARFLGMADSALTSIVVFANEDVEFKKEKPHEVVLLEELDGFVLSRPSESVDRKRIESIVRQIELRAGGGIVARVLHAMQCAARG